MAYYSHAEKSMLRIRIHSADLDVAYGGDARQFSLVVREGARRTTMSAADFSYHRLNVPPRSAILIAAFGLADGEPGYRCLPGDMGSGPWL